MDELYTFDNEYEYLLYELKKKEEEVTTESTGQPQPLFKITIPLNEEGKMEDEQQSEDSDGEDHVQDFIQEEYDLKLQVEESLITRIDH